MKTFKDRLIGKTLESIDSGIDDWGINFTDGTGITVYTRLDITLVSEEGPATVSSVNISDEIIELIVGKHSIIQIILDEDLLIGPEFFVFQDIDGSMVVGN